MPDKINQLKSIKEKEAKIMTYYKRNIIKNEIKLERPKRKTKKHIKKETILSETETQSEARSEKDHLPDSKNIKDIKDIKLTKKSPSHTLEHQIIGKSYEQIKAKQLEKNIVNMD
jgi:hypothetical protein